MRCPYPAHGAAVERVMLEHRTAVEIGELKQRHTVGDPFAPLAIIRVLDAHQNQRAQHLRRRQSAAALARLLQAAHEIAPAALRKPSIPELIDPRTAA
jgi:hypothetical protein